MKNYSLIAMLVNIVAIAFLGAQQQTYPNLWNVKISASISHIENNQMFYYSYTLTNSIESKGMIAGFEIDIARNPKSLDLDTVGLRFENDGYTEKNFKLDFPGLKGKIIPVGFLKTPKGMWSGGNTNALTADFSGVADEDFIMPGRTLGGFEMMSKGLPGIRRCIVSPYFDVIALFPDPADTTITYYVPPVDSVRNAVKYYGWTIGPVFSPIVFDAKIWLDTLVSYTTQSRSLGWIKGQTTDDRYLDYFSSAKTSLQQNNLASTRATLQRVLQDVNIDSTSNLTSEAYALIRFNTEYLLAQLPSAPVAGCNIKLINSAGARLTDGSLQYYEGSWKDATNNNDGTFFVNTTAKTLSLRMTYEYGSQTKSNIAIGSDTVVFQTVNAQVKLQNSQGIAIDTGSVQYYAGAWRNFGTTTNGTATKELLAANYSFRLTYAYASKDKQQDVGTNPTVVFQTVNAAVQLQNSQGVLMDQGTIQYYSGAWREFGSTSNGVANKELLPNNYSFRMTYAYTSKDKQQDIGTNSTVVFQTVNAAVQLKNSQGALIDQGSVQYYSGAWRTFGTTTNGIANKELLPNNYSFRMTYEYVSIDKSQDLSTKSTVDFSTVLCMIRIKNAQNQPVDGATASYYSGAWRQIGNTANGEVAKELLPVNLSFRIKYGTQQQQDKQQNLSTNTVVEFGIQ